MIVIDQETAQAAATAAATAAQKGTEMFSSQVGGAILLAYLLQWMKNSKLVPFVTEHTKGINYAMTGLMALAASIGIHYQFDVATGTLTIGGLTAGGLWHGTVEWAKQWAFQQVSANVVVTKSIAEQVKAGEVEKPTGITLAKDRV